MESAFESPRPVGRHLHRPPGPSLALIAIDGRSLREIKMILDHAQGEGGGITEHYLHMAPAHLREALDRLGELETKGLGEGRNAAEV